MIHKIEFGKNAALEVLLGTGDIRFHGLKFPDHPDKHCLGFCQVSEPRKIGSTSEEYVGATSDEVPEPIQMVLSFTKPESVTALIHSLIELQKGMFDKINEDKSVEV